jgi:hypothetical protein
VAHQADVVQVEPASEGGVHVRWLAGELALVEPAHQLDDRQHVLDTHLRSGLGA